MSIFQRFKAAFKSPEPATQFREAAGKTIDADEDNWRPLTEDARRDLSPVTQRRMQEIAVHLWERNLIARQIIELPVAYLLAEGVTVKVADEEASDWLRLFWRDPINRMAQRIEQMVRELSLFGEQCFPAFVNEMNGHVRIGVLDPSLIEQVIMDPDNSAQPIGIVTARDRKGRRRRYRVIVNGDENVFSKNTQTIRQQFADGECFYFAINQLSAGRRGRSDILAQADWADAYETFLFRAIDRSDLLNSFIWDVKMNGATQDQVEERAKKILPPKPNSVRVHNDSEEWKAETPDLKAADNQQLARLFRNHLLGGSAIPEHWFGGGGDVNRATAGEMGEPTFKTFSMRQAAVKNILTEICTYVVRCRLQRLYGANADNIAQQLAEDDYQVGIEFPEMTARDTTSYAAALAQVVIACATAIDRHLMTEETAVSIIGAIAGRLGVRIDPSEELRNAREARTAREENDVFADPPPDDSGDDADE
ncbi:hypothetical protein [Ferrovibrio terrae]|uniref:hypothetical protein n=1 Tax=Ferrovibrio terrae TaxID=2594003 RepID=UPI003137C304